MTKQLELKIKTIQQLAIKINVILHAQLTRALCSGEPARTWPDIKTQIKLVTTPDRTFDT